MKLALTFFKNLLKYLLNLIGFQIIQNNYLSKIKQNAVSQVQYDLSFFHELDGKSFEAALSQLPFSQSQLRQDLFVLSQSNFKKNGYFVEFGATDGYELSNSYLLEREFNWTGILAEPAKIWHSKLYENRNCHISTDCVWSETGKQLIFNEIGELSTLDEFRDKDLHAKMRLDHKKYHVKSISLNDLLLSFNAPNNIDYLSIDTEGSEFEILSNLNFNKFSFSVITVEHNFSDNRKKIYDLLTSHGYKQVFQEVSSFDDWYIKG